MTAKTPQQPPSRPKPQPSPPPPPTKFELHEIGINGVPFYAASEVKKYHARITGALGLKRNATVDEVVGAIERLRLYENIEKNGWCVRPASVPTGGDDYETQWEVVEYHMAEPHERVIGWANEYGGPIEAIKDALNPKEPNHA